MTHFLAEYGFVPFYPTPTPISYFCLEAVQLGQLIKYLTGTILLYSANQAFLGLKLRIAKICLGFVSAATKFQPSLFDRLRGILVTFHWVLAEIDLCSA